MAWIPNVNPNELVESAWGNTIRDHVVNTFASAAERTAAIPAPVAGMTSYRADAALLEVYRGGLWRPQIGTIVHSAVVAITDLNGTGLGLRDVTSVSQVVTFPYPTTSIVASSMIAGFGGDWVQFSHDVYGYGPNAVMAANGGVGANAGMWAGSPISTAWANLANASVGYKIRVNINATGGSGNNWHTSGSATLLVYAT